MRNKGKTRAADSLIMLSDGFIARLHNKEEKEEDLTLVGLADCASGACPVR